MDRDLRRLVVTGLALVVFLVVGRIVLAAVFDDAGKRREVAVARQRLSGGGAARPDSGEVTRVAGLRQALEEELAAVLPRLAYEQPAEFDVPAGQSADLRYIDVLQREQERLVQGARFVGKSVPQDLGMPVPNPTGTEEVLAALRALHVVHLVVGAGLDADIEAVDAIQIVPPARRRAQRGGLLRTHGVEFDLRGPPAAVAATLRAVVAGEPYLALDEVRLESLDEHGESLRCRMTVAAVVLDREALDELEVLD